MNWLKECHKRIDKDVAHIRESKYPQANVEHHEHSSLCAIPGVLLPPGWNKTICTLLFIAPQGFPAARPQNFWIDIRDLALDPPQENVYSDGERTAVYKPRNTENRDNLIPGFPQWRELTWFQWRLQAWDPNRDTLYTYMMSCWTRLKPAR